MLKKLLRPLFYSLPLMVAMLFFMFWMPGYSSSQKINSKQNKLELSLKKHTRVLSEKIGERHYRKYDSLLLARDYIKKQFEIMGYQTRLQEFSFGSQKFYNIEAEFLSDDKNAKYLIIGAHYDTAINSPGANDNASAVAILLELARIIKSKKTTNHLRFVAFSNEENPFYGSEQMGSFVYAKNLKLQKDKVLGMIALDSLGYYNQHKGSQNYPFGLHLFYPATGNFIAFVGNLNSHRFLRRMIGQYRIAGRVPSEGIVAPSFIPGISWSDHRSFWKHGYDAIMLTDTAPFRDPYYHSSKDTFERLNYPTMAVITEDLARIVR